jgi:hypothetical protein
MDEYEQGYVGNGSILKIPKEGMNSIYLVQDRYQWWTPVNTVMNCRVRFNKRRKISCLGKQLFPSQEKLCSMELVTSIVSATYQIYFVFIMIFFISFTCVRK